MITEQIVREAFRWPLAKELAGESFKGTLYRQDRLVERLEKLVSEGRTWTPISGATKRTLATRNINSEIDAQNAHLQRLLSSGNLTGVEPLDLDEFPLDPKGDGDSRIIATSSTILYLIDETTDFVECFREAFPHQAVGWVSKMLDQDIGTFVYISNSVDAGGRAFKGDPFTGQAAAYSRIFGWDMAGEKERNFVAYYPNQLISQFLMTSGSAPDAKGTKMLRREASLIITHKGVCLNPANWKVID